MRLPKIVGPDIMIYFMPCKAHTSHPLSRSIRSNRRSSPSLPHAGWRPSSASDGCVNSAFCVWSPQQDALPSLSFCGGTSSAVSRFFNKKIVSHSMRRIQEYRLVTTEKGCERYSQYALFFVLNSIIIQKITDTSNIKAVRECLQRICVCSGKKTA